MHMRERMAMQKSPSLRRRLLLFLLIPMLVLLLVDAGVTYGMALSYSNRVHDGDLADDVRTLAKMFVSEHVSGDLSSQAQFLLEYDPDGHNYYTVRSNQRGLLDSNDPFPQPPAPPTDDHPRLFNSSLGGKPLRAAALSVRSPDHPGEVLTVSIAETLHDRHERAKEILLLTIPLQTALILSILSLVWLGVTRGLRILQPLTRRLAAREHELGPISDTDVPVEILPLTRTIDGLFTRLATARALQERFLADAAHQLRTPLAGLSLHAERALSDASADTVKDALEHIHRLTQRTARASTQLLALTRAQSPWSESHRIQPVDLARVMPELVTTRIHDALRANIDLGYQGPDEHAWVNGDAGSLQELVENLIDNALRYAGHGARVTVSVLPLPDHGVLLQVEDSGPGVPPDVLMRLGERFFRAPDAREGGTGLGLAIVLQIADQHHAKVAFGAASGGGLRVTVQFPASTKSS